MATLGDIARARRMALVAQETGLGRESLYKSLSADGNPEFATVLKVVRALGLRLRAASAPGATDEQDARSQALLQESSLVGQEDVGVRPVSLRSREECEHG